MFLAISTKSKVAHQFDYEFVLVRYSWSDTLHVKIFYVVETNLGIDILDSEVQSRTKCHAVTLRVVGIQQSLFVFDAIGVIRHIVIPAEG